MAESELTKQELLDLATRISNWHKAGNSGFEGSIEGIVLKTAKETRPYDLPGYCTYSISAYLDGAQVGLIGCGPHSKRDDYKPIVNVHSEASRIAHQNRINAITYAREVLERLRGGR